MESGIEERENRMSLRTGLAIYLLCLGIWLLLLKLAVNTTWFPNGALIAFHISAGFVLNRWVLRGLIEWHPHYATLDAVVKAKLISFIFWPLSYGGILLRLLINKLL